MTPEQFVRVVRESVLEEELEFYVTRLETLGPGDTKDPYWSRALSLYKSLDEDNREVLKEMIRQILVDAVALLLGLLDGTCCVAGLEENLVLTTETDPTRINEFIQELFFMAEQMGTDGA